MYADDPTSLFDSTQKLFLFCKGHRCQLIVNWSRFAPCDCNMLQSWARRLAVRANGMAVYLPLALENPFPLMSVSSSVGDQGPVESNGVGSYSMKIPKSMDRESVLFWIGQRFLIHMTQEGCSGLSHLWRRLLMRKTQQRFIATLYRPLHASSLYAVGGLWTQRLGMQKWAKFLWGWQANDFISSASWLHSSWTNALNIEHCHKRIDQYSRLISIFVVDVVSHKHWQFHIHTDSLCPKYV